MADSTKSWNFQYAERIKFMGIVIAVVVLMFLGIAGGISIVILKPSFVFKMQGLEYDEENTRKGEGTATEGQNGANPVDGQPVRDTKKFLPHRNIEDGIIDLGYHNYRAIVECSSLNYFLMSDVQQQMVEASYQRFLNSITFPISIYIQTREFDTESMMSNLWKNIESAEKKFPSTSGYMREYAANMEALTEYIGNEKIKKKYIIVYYNSTELSGLSSLTSGELREYAVTELKNRCQIIINGLAGVGISAKRLDTDMVTECIYAYIHRTSYLIAKEIADGTFDSLSIDGENKLDDKTVTMTAILSEAQERINTQLRAGRNTNYEDIIYSYVTGVLEYFKDRLESDEGIQELLNVANQNEGK